jgi:hypothetical protein
MRTVLRIVGVVGGLAVLLALPAAPAGARDDGDLAISSNDELVWPGGGALGLVFVTIGDRRLDRLEVDIDLTDVDDFTEFLLPSDDEFDCTITGPQVHCEAHDVEFNATFYFQVFGLDNGTPTGHTGQMRLKATAGTETAEGSARIIMAEPADLASSAEVHASGPPGARFGLQVPVRNVGSKTVDGTVLTLELDEFIPYQGDYSNCTDYEVFIECVFDDDLAPGTTYGFSEDVPLFMDPRGRTGAVVGSFAHWWTAADWDRVDQSWKEQLSGFPGVPGTGAPLRLVELPTASRTLGLPQTDVDPFSNFSTLKVTVTGDHPADLAATGSTGAGAVGTTVRIQLTVKNLGPADLHDGYQLSVPLAYVDVPEGTTAVEVSSYCAPFTTLEDWKPFEEGGTPGADRYACQGEVIPADGLFAYEFGFRVDEVIDDATGSFRVDLAGDPDEANDAAEIVINPSGGDLPVTGASLSLVIAVGALLLGVGVTVLVLVRRRRTPAPRP